MTLTHEAVQKLHVKQRLRRHDTIAFLQNGRNLLADILNHLGTHGKVIQHSRRSQGCRMNCSQGEQELHVSQMANISNPMLSRLLDHPLQQVIRHGVTLLDQLPSLLHHRLEELPHPATVLLAAVDRGRQLQLHDERPHELGPPLDLRRAGGDVVGEVDCRGQVRIVAAVVRPDEYVARDDRNNPQEDGEDGEWGPVVARRDL